MLSDFSCSVRATVLSDKSCKQQTETLLVELLSSLQFQVHIATFIEILHS